MPQQLFTWRRQARQPVVSELTPEPPMFVPAIVGTSSPPSEPRRRPRRRGRKAAQGADTVGMIEMEIDGVAVRVGRGADAKTVAAVIRALKAGT
jgi:transposase